MSHTHNHHGHHSHDHEHHHHHEHSHDGSHGHTHGLVDETIVRSKEGVKAVSLSFTVLFFAALLQLIIFTMSGSIALLTDVIHNAGDSLTAIPLGLAFLLHSKKGERWAGYSIVMVIFVSAIVAIWQAIEKFVHPQTPTHLGVLVAAGVVGILGNEVAAIIRWRAGRRLNSPALIADGNHARADGIVSAGVIVSAVLIAMGMPIADPIIGIGISLLILHSSWQSLQTIRES